jgi:hypothetical protein
MQTCTYTCTYTVPTCTYTAYCGTWLPLLCLWDVQNCTYATCMFPGATKKELFGRLPEFAELGFLHLVDCSSFRLEVGVRTASNCNKACLSIFSRNADGQCFNNLSNYACNNAFSWHGMYTHCRWLMRLKFAWLFKLLKPTVHNTSHAT